MLNTPVFVMKSGFGNFPPVPETFSMVVYIGEHIGPFSVWKLGLEPKLSRKSEVSSLIAIHWFNSCNETLFAGIPFTLILVSCSLFLRHAVTGADPAGVDWGGRSPTTYESNSVTMIFYKSENSIRDIRSFCRPLLCPRSVVKHTSSLLQ